MEGEAVQLQRIAALVSKVGREGSNGRHPEEARALIGVLHLNKFVLRAADFDARRLERGAPADVVEMPVRQKDVRDDEPALLRLGKDARFAWIDGDGVFSVRRDKITICREPHRFDKLMTIPPPD